MFANDIRSVVRGATVDDNEIVRLSGLSSNASHEAFDVIGFVLDRYGQGEPCGRLYWCEFLFNDSLRQMRTHARFSFVLSITNDDL